MESGTTTMCASNNRSISIKELREQQEQYAEGSNNWSYYQSLINQIIAQNYLEYVNR